MNRGLTVIKTKCTQECRKPGGNGPLVKRGNSQDCKNDIDFRVVKCDVVDWIHPVHDRIPCLLAVNTIYFSLNDRLHC